MIQIIFILNFSVFNGREVFVKRILKSRLIFIFINDFNDMQIILKHCSRVLEVRIFSWRKKRIIREKYLGTMSELIVFFNYKEIFQSCLFHIF